MIKSLSSPLVGLALVFSLFGVASLARADLQLPFAGADIRTYQIGSEWGKLPVPPDSLKDRTPVFRRAALATARFGGGTAFYLGVIDGQPLMATNHHVLPTAAGCAKRPADFPIFGKNFPCLKWIGAWTDIDLALFTIEVKSTADLDLLAGVAANFKFNAEFRPGQELLTIGFGVAGNPKRELMANADADCKVFSAAGEFRFMADPDSISPSPTRTWSFANGCDVSHGDSGSAMVDRQTGSVLGIIWTGRIPKDPAIQDSKLLDQILSAQDERLWTELSYAVPAPKIREFMESELAQGRLPAGDAAVLRDLIARSGP